MDILNPRSALAEAVVREASAPALNPGEARLKTDAFALTANNITYAAFGDMMKYWDFFPAPEGFARTPVWGFAEVAESQSEAAPVGARVYGYFPMSNELVVIPGKAAAHGFMDMAAHRQEMASTYNQYLFKQTDPIYATGSEALQMLFRPLFTTAFLLDDLIADGDLPDQLILSSASSKTAFALAALAKARGVSVVGLTSSKNVAFVEGLGFYASVHTYDEADRLSDKPSAYVDFAGNPNITAGVHNALGDALSTSLVVGATDWEAPKIPQDMAGPAPQFFFAPDRAAQRANDWGAAFPEKLAAAHRAFFKEIDGKITVETLQGAQSIAEAWRSLAAGDVAPDRGLICRL